MTSRGTLHWNHKLTDDQAREVKYSKEKAAVFVLKYGITAALVSLIRNGRRWAHV